MCVDANVYHRDTCRLWRRVLIMFCSLCFFRYEWSKFALLYLVFKSFLEVKGGCMGIVKTKGDSSQILEENNDNATCKRSQEIWLQSVVFNLLNVPHIVPGCHIQQPGIPPQNVGVITVCCKGKNVLQASLWCRENLWKKRGKTVCFIDNVCNKVNFSETGLQRFLSPPVETQTTTRVLSYVNYCLMGLSSLHPQWIELFLFPTCLFKLILIHCHYQKH